MRILMVFSRCAMKISETRAQRDKIYTVSPFAGSVWFWIIIMQHTNDAFGKASVCSKCTRCGSSFVRAPQKRLYCNFFCWNKADSICFGQRVNTLLNVNKIFILCVQQLYRRQLADSSNTNLTSVGCMSQSKQTMLWDRPMTTAFPPSSNSSIVSVVAAFHYN